MSHAEVKYTAFSPSVYSFLLLQEKLEVSLSQSVEKAKQNHHHMRQVNHTAPSRQLRLPEIAEQSHQILGAEGAVALQHFKSKHYYMFEWN